MSLVGGERCQSVFSNQTFNNYSSLCAENRHSATCEVRKPIKRVDNAKTARRVIAEDRLPSWAPVIVTLWLDWSVKGSRRIIATRWKRLILPILYFAYSVSIFCAPFLLLKLSIPSPHLASIQTLPTISDGSRTRWNKVFWSSLLFFLKIKGEGKRWNGILLCSFGISSSTW